MTRQPGGRKISIAGIMIMVCVLVLGGEAAIFILSPVSRISNLAKQEEKSVYAIRGLSSQDRVNFIRRVQNNFACAERWFHFKEQEKNLQDRKRALNANPQGKDKSLEEELESIPFQAMDRFVGVEKAIEWFRKYSWVVSLICFRLAVLFFPWVGILWGTCFSLAFILGMLRRRKAMLTGGTFSSYAFHLSRGLGIILLIIFPAAYLLSPIRVPVTFFFCVWVLPTCWTIYKMLGNLPAKL